ncbi:MAG: gamma carbonic anhydrase family protein [Myxococcaceae bacterium]
MGIISYEGKAPKIPSSVFVASSAQVIGDVELGESASVWFGAILRGDVNGIRVGARTNVQDGTIIHVTHEQFSTLIGRDVTIGHRAVIHGCTVKDRCLIGIGAILLDGVEVGEDSVIAAGALLTPGTVIPPGSMVMGSPGRVKRPLKDFERAGLLLSSEHYVQLASTYRGR